MTTNWGDLIDIETLEKGSVISAAIVEQVTGVSRTKISEYNLAILGLKIAIDQALETMGIVYTIRIDHQKIRVLKDNEASRYNDAARQTGVRKILRAHHKLTHVDETMLLSGDKNIHDRNLFKSGCYYESILRAKVEVKAIPYERKTPTMDFEKEEDQS